MIVVGAALAMGASVAHGQQEYFTARARDALERSSAPWRTRGFEPVGEIRVGALLEREKDSLNLELEPGWQYVALGMCDEDCGDLDFHLFDGADKQVGFDVASNARPIVQVTPTAAGAYRLQVVMGQCSAPPCFYGVQLLRKPKSP